MPRKHTIRWTAGQWPAVVVRGKANPPALARGEAF